MESCETTSEDHQEVLARHRQDRKDLQSKITSLKKTVPKNDKKKKKDLTDMIAQLEQELAERHKNELATLTIITEQGSSNENEVASTSLEEPTSDEKETGDVKVSRAQRRRNKKDIEIRERNKRIQEQEQKNKSGPRSTEITLIKETLKHIGLTIHNVPADGNCLYCSIKHQLEVSNRPSYDVETLRELTANFIRENKDEFLPFMCNDSDEVVGDKHFEKYCHDVANTKQWGGQLELRALSNILKCPIKIIQANGPPTIQGEQFTGDPLTITYHRHLYRLGEHYNSTKSIEQSIELDTS